ncbi:MAG TPA: RsmE family RNA methyltransferase [Acidimicrobiia bacterium]
MAGPAGYPAAEGAVAHVLVDGLGEHLTVEGDDGHHLQRVRRIRPGELLTAADGAGRWRRYLVGDVGPGRLALTAGGPVHEEPPLEPGLAVAFGVTKGEAPELVVGQLTQLGVDRIVAVTTARSVVRWSGDKAEKARRRLQRVAREAAMQSRRARLPIVELADSLQPLTARPHPDLVVAERGGGDVATLPTPASGGWLLVVGPEGGLEPGEREHLEPARSVGLGPFQLRATTAATVVTGLFTCRRRAAIFSRGKEP